MADAKVDYKEVRFLIEDFSTEMYVFLLDMTPGLTPARAPGWHHRSFPITLSILDIMEMLRAGDVEDPMLWERLAPPGVGELSV